MRLLLLLSALLTALAGVTGTRVAAQPVHASAVAAVERARAVVVVPASRRPVAALYAALPPLTLGARASVAAIAARPLYAERRRE